MNASVVTPSASASSSVLERSSVVTNMMHQRIEEIPPDLLYQREEYMRETCFEPKTCRTCHVTLPWHQKWRRRTWEKHNAWRQPLICSNRPSSPSLQSELYLRRGRRSRVRPKCAQFLPRRPL